ncbi:glycosyltransferase [Desertifilum sp. FACHB-1129]|uniref:Glycosyl transferase family 2 n=2 Tax=Desertifilum tharense IPPAS B-1220 TaxID=1781255 RepID=A0A1E5QJ69_9CYAN|nr:MULTISPECIES: glycosyltransferase family 2 protein [Desertifilum]MDA0212520.1 glycosyltransferase family 2 protein [Cyanobacteria bacterium FC1]MBD2314641.1 glycosyltransferase [Desertifilum sp. FACHB-1129]MBD2324940.1 glycosyltransferase [Desertifilum sp. FACHB-866]MBD2335079.1 glycosyltransferase [Desertifilum sp. FACHB-868]OEJ74634.1 glycosyl transferase family 2 [Desertifilum tharense IPPAS B-1220]
MNNPRLSIIIPTYNRPHLLPRAVKSALEQTIEEIEVIVVDDGSKTPPQLEEHPKLKVIRFEQNQGNAVVRNAGAKAAKGQWISYLDDDDRLLPTFAETSLNALEKTHLPKPVAAISALAVVNNQGEVLQTRVPPTLPRGSYFFLEEIEPQYSFLSKQTLFIERELFLSIGGFDESFRSRVYTELYLRLNPICSLLGIPEVTYHLTAHEGPRVSRNPAFRQTSFEQLIAKHQNIFESHPKGFANFLYSHAQISSEQGQLFAAAKHLIWAMSVEPRHILGTLTWPYREKLKAQQLISHS